MGGGAVKGSLVLARVALVALVAAVLGPATPALAAGGVTVAADGSGNYTTVQAAVDAAPANQTSTFTITIKPGTYRGTVSIPSNKPHLSLVGAGSSASAVVLVENHASGTPKLGGGTYGTS